MTTKIKDSEKTYRLVDGIYRLQRGLFEIENVLLQTTKLQIQLARLNINGRAMVGVTGLLAVVPIIISLCDIKWGSVPAIIIYLIVGFVAILLLYQICKVGGVERKLSTFEGRHSSEVLEDRKDFVFEEINAYANRHRLIDGIISELSDAVDRAQNPNEKQELEKKQIRYKDILSYCENYVEGIIIESEKLVARKKRSKEDHDELLDWCAAIPKFARKNGDGA